MLKYRILSVLIILNIFLSSNINAQLVADFSVDHSIAEYCMGDTVYFTNISTGNFVNTQWKFGDNIDTWGNNPEHIYLTDGIFSAWIIITDITGLQDSTSHSVMVHESPKINLVNNADEKTLTVHTGLTDVNFMWYFGVNLTDETDSVVYYLETGKYSVVAYNEFCSDSISTYITDTIAVENQPEITVKNNILTPDNNDGINDILFIQDLGMYSNKVFIQIYNKWGQLVYENEEYTNLGGFSGSDNKGNKLDAGTYYYIVKCEGRKGGSGFVDIIR